MKPCTGSSEEKRAVKRKAAGEKLERLLIVPDIREQPVYWVPDPEQVCSGKA